MNKTETNQLFDTLLRHHEVSFPIFSILDFFWEEQPQTSFVEDFIVC